MHTIFGVHITLIFLQCSLKNTPIQLFGPAGKSLEVLGQASVKLSYDSRSATQSIFVVKGVSTNLLGLPAICALQLLTITDEVESSIPDKYPKLFAGLGTFQGEYEIKLKVDAQPVAIYTARNVPLPLREKVQGELARMERIGVISPVKEPTPWCLGMVVVPKKSGAVRICVDFHPLNESVMREIHPLPTVEETLSQLSGHF